MTYPKIVRIKQKFPRYGIENVNDAVKEEVEGIIHKTRIKAGDSVAVTVGSRGIANLAKIVYKLIEVLRSKGCNVFIVPSMGSHGGATDEGQVKVLEHYGITEQAMKVPIKSSMAVEEVGKTIDGLSVFVDKNALTADHIVIFNRVKVHTDFRGTIESGLSKIMAIGLGKHKGAQYYHQAAVNYGGSHIIRTVGSAVINYCPVAFGLAVVEDAFDDIAIVKAILPENIQAEEEKLLIKSKELMAKLPFNRADILIVDEIGKNISGTGMDTNVIGRFMNIYTEEPNEPKITRIFVRDLTNESDGNAIGVGLADYTTSRLVNSIDWKATYTNVITGLVVEKARIPVVCKTDKEAFDLLFKTIGLIKPEKAKLMWIKNTLSLSKMYVSEAFLPEVRNRTDLEIIGEPEDIVFDKEENLINKYW